MGGDNLLFAQDLESEAKTSLMTIYRKTEYMESDPTPDAEEYDTPYNLYQKEFYVNFLEFINIAKISKVTESELKEKVKNQEKMLPAEEKKVLDTFMAAILEKAAATAVKNAAENKVEVAAVNDDVIDEQ